jgi:hypothetical protein
MKQSASGQDHEKASIAIPFCLKTIRFVAKNHLSDDFQQGHALYMEGFVLTDMGYLRLFSQPEERVHLWERRSDDV